MSIILVCMGEIIEVWCVGSVGIACNLCRDKHRTTWSVLVTMIRSTDELIPTCYPRWSVLVTDCYLCTELSTVDCVRS